MKARVTSFTFIFALAFAGAGFSWSGRSSDELVIEAPPEAPVRPATPAVSASARRPATPAAPAVPATPAAPAAPATPASPAPAARSGDWNGPWRHQQSDARATVKGRRVSLSTETGDVIVDVGSGDELLATAIIEYGASDEAWLERVPREFKLAMTESTNEIHLVTQVPEASSGLFGRRRVAYSVRVTLHVPRATALTLENAYGDVKVEGVGGSLDVRTAPGRSQPAVPSGRWCWPASTVTSWRTASRVPCR